VSAPRWQKRYGAWAPVGRAEDEVEATGRAMWEARTRLDETLDKAGAVPVSPIDASICTGLLSIDPPHRGEAVRVEVVGLRLRHPNPFPPMQLVWRLP
jgi:hypothetical protein